MLFRWQPPDAIFLIKAPYDPTGNRWHCVCYTVNVVHLIWELYGSVAFDQCKMADILQTVFSNVFLMKIIMVWIKVHWSLFLKGSVGNKLTHIQLMTSLIARFMGPAWVPSGAEMTQVGPMLAPWTLLSGLASNRRQAITWINDNHDSWKPMSSLGRVSKFCRTFATQALLYY